MVKVPRAAAAESAPAAAVAASWDPPSELRRAVLCAEPCPHCDAAQVYADPRGITRGCLACKTRVTPPGVLAPYQRGTAAGRQVTSQRESDLTALGLAGRKGTMLGELRALTDSGRLDDASQMKAEWFAEQVKAAGSSARLDELAALFGEAGIRPRHWWQARPAPITAAGADDARGGYDDGYDDGGYAGYDDEDDDGGYAGYDDEDDDEPTAVTALVLATPASIAAQQYRAQPQRATWAEAFAAYGWRLAPPRGDSTCQVIERDGRCAEEIGGHPPVTDGLTRDGWTCSGHYYALVEITVSINRARGFT